jgi:IclR family transcriptional regulator, KDG regulon repressor
MPKKSNRAISKDSGEQPTRYRVEAITRAVGLLRQFNRTTPRRSIDELSRSLGTSTSLTRRMLHTLEQHRLVRLADDRERYELGLAWLRLADVRRRQVDMRQLALPVMRRMRDALNETIILAIRVGWRRINIDYVESTQAFRRLTQPGFEAPLHIGSAGRTLMVGLSPDELEKYLESVPLVGFRTNTSVSKAELIKQLGRVRKDGFAVSFREITSDTAAVAAPIRDHAGETVASLTISCPDDRFTPALQRACITEITRGAEEVSRAMGFNSGPPG